MPPVECSDTGHRVCSPHSGVNLSGAGKGMALSQRQFQVLRRHDATDQFGDAAFAFHHAGRAGPAL